MTSSQTPRRVLQVLGRSAGGIARHVAQVTEALDGNGLVIDIACPAGLPVAMPKSTFELDIPDGPTGGHIAAIRRLRKIIDQGAYDVVHAHGLRAGIDAGLARKGMKAQSIVTVHNLIHPAIAGPKASVYARAEPLAVRLSDRALAVSAEIASRIARGRPGLENKIEVLYLGIGDSPTVRRSRAEIRSELEVDGGSALIVTAARLAAQKALHVMFEAVAQLPSTVLALLGEGPLEDELKHVADELGVSDRVRFLGFRTDIADYVAAADVFGLSSVWEGVPLSVHEAIVLGTPVVATRVGGMPELIEDDVSGLLVPPGDPAALAGAINRVAHDPDLAARMAGAAKERTRTMFSTERMLERLRELYVEGPRAG
jgi:glycosyltransferase involved in cell wall biosynthesis